MLTSSISMKSPWKLWSVKQSNFVNHKIFQKSWCSVFEKITSNSGNRVTNRSSPICKPMNVWLTQCNQ